MASELRLSDVILFSPQDTEAMLRAAVECYSDGNFSQAEAILVGLTALDEADSRPVKLLASTLLLSGRHVEAEAVYERAHALDSDDLYTLVALGEIKLKSLKVAEAIPLFERLFELDPDGTHPAANRGRDLVQTHYQMLAAAT